MASGAWRDKEAGTRVTRQERGLPAAAWQRRGESGGGTLGKKMPEPADGLVKCGQNVGKKRNQRLKTACFQRFHDKTVRGRFPASSRIESRQKWRLFSFISNGFQKISELTAHDPRCIGYSKKMLPEIPFSSYLISHTPPHHKSHIIAASNSACRLALTA